MISHREAAQVRRRKERKTKKVTRFPSGKRAKEIVEDTARLTMLDHDSTICQYLMAERFVKSILEYQRETQKDVREIAKDEIADVLLKRLMSFNEYTDAKNSDRATQQLRFLADVVASWMNEILVKVFEIRKEALKEYNEKRRMRTLKVNDGNKTNNKIAGWKQMNEK